MLKENKKAQVCCFTVMTKIKCQDSKEKIPAFVLTDLHNNEYDY